MTVIYNQAQNCLGRKPLYCYVVSIPSNESRSINWQSGFESIMMKRKQIASCKSVI